ncbi:MAG: hypothetical protein K2M12_02700, partial [Muribaculaceae bacterium]|nr:hypothetical protein [Muribaculaceae bacterium]
YKGGVSLNVFGPSPVARGGELRFLGSGMDQITKVTIPGCGDITEIKVISKEEIRVVVPQTAQPGTVVLHHAGGTIETKTMLTYLEPISIESIDPLRVKPGQELTIKGEYLNLINEVCFSFVEDSVNVYADAFLTHERSEIKVIVPEEAISGTIFLSDAKAIPNMIESEMEVEIVLPATTPLDLTDAVPGQTITITGTDLDLVTAILLPDGSELDFEYADGKITFVLPENVMDGSIVMVTASGVKVACANVGVVVPTELEAVPAEGLRGGDVLKIKGVNMDQVTSLVFPNVADAVTPATISATELTAAWPDMAQSGEVVMNLKSGKTVSVAVATAKPEVLSFEPAEVPAAAEFTMKGKNLDLVVAITFTGGTKVEVSGLSASEYTMLAPATAESGALTLHMANGESVETPSLTIKAPECAYITVQPEGELTAYGLFIANVANEDKLTGVKVNGQDVNYILNNGQLYITLPGTCGKNTTVTLVSSNGEISYTYDVIPATHQERVLLSTPVTIGNWDEPRIYLTHDQFADVPVGAKLVFYIEPSNGAQLQLNDANWASYTILEFPAGATQGELELTAEVLEFFSKNNGYSDQAMIIQGHDCTVNKITIEWEISLEEVIWQGAWENASWGGNQDLAWGGFDWSTVKAGTTLRVYMTPTVADGEWWCVSLRHGMNWGNLPGNLGSQIDMPAGGLAEVVLTQEVIDDLVDNGGLVITGQGYILNKVTLE